MTTLAGLIGYPLSHSISPAFQQPAFDYYSLSIRYDAWPTPPGRLRDEVLKLRGEEYVGANVTVPYKEQVPRYLDDIEPWARRVGAVNTIVKEGERLIGCNTDADGFVTSLKLRGEFQPRGRSVLLIGAGGAARAAAFALAKEGVASLVIANRTLDRAQSLVEDVRGPVTEVTAIPMSDSTLGEAASAVDLIVNATSLGMLHSDGAGRSPLQARVIPSSVFVYDMVYNPPETPLMAEARRAGARVMGGLPMLVYQGAGSFERWTGRRAPIDVMFRAAEQALASLSRAC